MGNSTKDKIDERKLKILDTAFDIFVEKTIEAVSRRRARDAFSVLSEQAGACYRGLRQKMERCV